MSGSHSLKADYQAVEHHVPGPGVAGLTPDVRRRLLVYARGSWPEEACGLLLGRGRRVEDLARLSNCSPTPRQHYALDPLEYMHAERCCDQRGLRVLGVWHSHPESAAVPSDTDQRDAWPGWLYVIVGQPREQAPDLRGWQLENGQFRQAVLHFTANDDTASGSP